MRGISGVRRVENMFNGPQKQHWAPLQPMNNAVPIEIRHRSFQEEEEEHQIFDIGITIGDPQDPQDVCEYESIVYTLSRMREGQFPEPEVVQPEVTASDRGKLVDWLCRLHYKCQLTTNALYVCVGILDRVLRKVRISVNKLLLYGCAAMLIASKEEDIQPIQIDQIIMVSEGVLNRQDLIQMENYILDVIDYDITFPTPLFFLTHFLRISNKSMEAMLMARYVMEIELTLPEFIGTASSYMASLAILITRVFCHEEPWTEELAIYTGYSFGDLCNDARFIHQALLIGERPECSFIRRKYASEPFYRVALVEVPRVLPTPFDLF